MRRLQRGATVADALLRAGLVRMRPIIMTSVAFIAGVLPLATASGAGANGRQAIGTGVMGGMITATVLAVFLVPVFFIVVRRLFPASGGAPHGMSISAPLPVPHTPSRVPAAPAHPGDPA